ncbi:uncharacterized protein [Littorina saxatilis]|uniref:Alpha/beta hydrolase fold-5 domain-containing protein n=1 Tax=Littorina saxatilis TaxID=31220 RepID=A0AAN9G9N6_9CAEN
MELTRSTVSLLLLSAAIFAVTTGIVTPSIMAPTKGGTTEAALIIVPGASIKGEAYRPLATHIQGASPLKLWVVLLEGFIMTTPNPLELGGAISSAIAALKKQGMTTDNIFVAGHSLGGVFVGEYGITNASELKGILLYASYLTRDVKLASYPLPVLTISGDLDGLTRLTRIVDSFQELEDSLSKNPTNKYRTPVVTMPGVSHAQFASGQMPKAVTDKDLKPEVTSAAAYVMIANHTSAFLLSSLGDSVPQNLRSTAWSDLDKAYNDTNTIMQPLLTVKEMDQNSQNSVQWAIQAQYLQSGLTKKQVKVTDELLSEMSFLDSKPKIQGSGNDFTIQTFAHLAFSSNPLDISTVPSAPRVLSFKMKTFEAVKDAMPAGTTFNTSASNITCKNINQAAFNLALQSSSPVARRRYLDHGRPIFFNDDVLHSTGLGWSTSNLGLQEDDQGLHVTSQALKTRLHEPINLFSGMHYCKGLSPYRAMEWIYVDSLRSHA